jgi:hypothetical protein
MVEMAERKLKLAVVACAWCERLSSDREAWFRPPVWRFFLRSRELETGLSHGICPSCFSKLAPDVPYPERP